MKTLKQELQQILDEKKLSKEIFICKNLSKGNIEQFDEHQSMARNYAKKYFYGGYAWWRVSDSKHNNKYLRKEKYRFIHDLIKILP